ncbi:MAG TPA: hypothetical protein PKW33_02090 [Anaerolineaceae bacterium]|nr:hypothetical protein [Anaerolineaceae bacterium]HPN50350.1 hypothetical protein [Anaerolineaceae bacterium]
MTRQNRQNLILALFAALCFSAALLAGCGGNPTAEAPFDFVATTTPLPAYEAGTGQVLGRVTCAGTPMPEKRVLLLMVIGNRYEVYDSALTDAEGNWFINNVAPGEYIEMVSEAQPFGSFVIDSRRLRMVEMDKVVDFGTYNFNACPPTPTPAK